MRDKTKGFLDAMSDVKEYMNCTKVLYLKFCIPPLVPAHIDTSAVTVIPAARDICNKEINIVIKSSIRECNHKARDGNLEIYQCWFSGFYAWKIKMNSTSKAVF